MIWTRVEHEKSGVRLVLSDTRNGDVDLRLSTVQAENSAARSTSEAAPMAS